MAETYTQIPTDRLRELLELEAKATPGDWREGGSGNPRVYGPDGCGPDTSGIVAAFARYQDRPFIAAARNSIRSLILEVIESRECADTPDPVRHKTACCPLCHCSQTLPQSLQQCGCSCHWNDRIGNAPADPVRDELLAALIEAAEFLQSMRQGLIVEKRQAAQAACWSVIGKCQAVISKATVIRRAESPAPAQPCICPVDCDCADLDGPRSEFCAKHNRRPQPWVDCKAAIHWWAAPAQETK